MHGFSSKAFYLCRARKLKVQDLQRSIAFLKRLLDFELMKKAVFVKIVVKILKPILT